MTTTGIVLSGGGARGAYEAGVIRGIVEVLRLTADDPSPIDVFSGTSVGALNVTHLAASAHRGDLDTERLLDTWRALSLREFLRFDSATLLDWPRAWLMGRRDGLHRRALFDPRPLERVVRDEVRWQSLAENIAAGRVHALTVAAMHVETGASDLFTWLAPDVDYHEALDERRVVRRTPIGPEHVLASSAIPMLYPARFVEDGWYVDGGLRINTPIAPAIRAGARRLVVVSLQRRAPPLAARRRANVAAYPNPLFLAGKVLNALLLDPVSYDLHLLHRVNQLHDILVQQSDPAGLGRIHAALGERRGLPYQRVEALVFEPSTDISILAGTHLEKLTSGGGVAARLLRAAMGANRAAYNDLASYLLFDGDFAAALIDLGRSDAHARHDAIRAFFSPVRRRV